MRVVNHNQNEVTPTVTVDTNWGTGGNDQVSVPDPTITTSKCAYRQLLEVALPQHFPFLVSVRAYTYDKFSTSFVDESEYVHEQGMDGFLCPSTNTYKYNVLL